MINVFDITMRMNKMINIFRSAALILLLAACNNEYEPVFNETPDERIRKVIDEYRNTLINAPNGYKGIIYTGTGGAYMFYLDFKDNGEVTMVSDFDTETAETPMDGTFVIKALQRPTLSFDTYSYIHILADPSPEVNGGIAGEGLISDVEFAFEEFNGDSVEVKGIQRNTEMILVAATPEEANEFLNGQLKFIIDNTTNYLTENPYPYFETSNGTQVSVDIDQVAKTITFISLTGNDVQQITQPFSYSTNGLLLKDAIPAGNASFQEILWDEDEQSFYVQLGNQRVYFESSDTPVIPLVYAMGTIYTLLYMDLTETPDQPAEFMTIYNQAKDQLITVGGYNLVLDAFGLLFEGDVVTIVYLIHNNNGNYQARYSYSKTISSNGRISFTLTGQDGNAAVIAEGLEPLLDYFADNSFEFDYDPEGAIVTPQQSPAAYFKGILE